MIGQEQFQDGGQSLTDRSTQANLTLGARNDLVNSAVSIGADTVAFDHFELNSFQSVIELRPIAASTGGRSSLRRRSERRRPHTSRW